jgi:hypothetical protein
MAILYKRNEIADFEFIFLDAVTNEPIDITSPVYTISRFNSNVEIIVVPSTSLTRFGVGKYVTSWTIPPTVVFDTYFVRASGLHPVTGTTTILEESFKVVSDDYFSQTSGLVIKFTKD